MSLVTRKRKNFTVYYVVFTWQGERVWEHAGKDKREAMRLNDRRKREVKNGTYTPRSGQATSVYQFCNSWLDKRKNRSASNERALLERHVLDREALEWFTEKPIVDVRPADCAQLVTELKAQSRDPKDATSPPLAGKSVSIIAGCLRTMFRDAHFAELTTRDPWQLPRGVISKKPTKKRTHYPAEDVRRILGAQLDPDEMVFAHLALYTGCRGGEICGRRFSHWDRESLPLGCLTVDTQYNDQPLKTDDDHDEHPRKVPVHPDLAHVLEWWLAEGFELVHCRKPAHDDFILPRRTERACHSKSTAHKMWLRICERAQVENRSLHSTRHTFITMARRCGARPDVLEKVTHNSKGDQFDQYTHWEWQPLCEAVALLSVDASVDVRRGTVENKAKHLAVNTVPNQETTESSGVSRERPLTRVTANRSESLTREADRCAGQHRLPLEDGTMDELAFWMCVAEQSTMWEASRVC